MLLIAVQCYSLSLSDPSSSPHPGPLQALGLSRHPWEMQTACPRQSPAALWPSAGEPHSGQPCTPAAPSACPEVVPSSDSCSFGALCVCVVAQCLACSANTTDRIYEQLQDFGWGSARSALWWCSKCQQRGKPAAEGVCRHLPGGSADGFGVKVVAGFLWRGMSWTTSGPVQRVFPQRRMGRIVSCKSWLVSVISAQQILFAPSFSSCSRSLSA